MSTSNGDTTSLDGKSIYQAMTGPPPTESKMANGDQSQLLTSTSETGISKNELKRRLKAERKAKESAQKAAQKAAKEAERAAQAATQKASGQEADMAAARAALQDSGDKLDPSQYKAHREAMISAMRSEGLNPYPHKFETTLTIPNLIGKFASALDKKDILDEVVSIAGRIYSKRAPGSRLVFYDLKGDGMKVQIIANAQNATGNFVKEHSRFRRGDIVGVRGFPGKSKTGEFSIFASEVVLLSSCLHMLPTMRQELSDGETRFRQRYLDLIMNNRTRETFVSRSKIVRFIRNFLDERSFLEVETPMMNTVPGGATAKPFETYHNELSTKMYMRIAPELYLKMLVVGGLDRVYEIGRNFRNEGIDATHNPEFTACEFYAAYLDYSDLMVLSEELLSSLVKSVTGNYKIEYHPNGPEKEKIEIDFTPPFKRISMMSYLQEKLRGKLSDPDFCFPEDLSTEETRVILTDLCVRCGIADDGPKTTAKLLDSLVGEFIEPECINPTFICDHPAIMSPLAKWHRNLPGMTERFELFANGKELCNAYTELNDPKVQRERFMRSQVDKIKGEDDEAMVHDEDFCVALEYGLPPTAGWGLGIDRLTMMLTDHNSIREVLLFPTMKPLDV